MTGGRSDDSEQQMIRGGDSGPSVGGMKLSPPLEGEGGRPRRCFQGAGMFFSPDDFLLVKKVVNVGPDGKKVKPAR